MSAHETIRCDHCHAGYTWTRLGYGATNWQILRDTLKSEGWHMVKPKGQVARDICGECWAKGLR